MKSTVSRTSFCVLVVLILSGIAGAAFGSQARPTAQSEADIESSLRNFSSVLALVEENYADPVSSEKAVYGAIDGMLRTLDPHSRFFDPRSFTALREEQRGRYYGLGIMIGTRFGKITIVSPPFLGSPAEKVGLRVGDVISLINGESTEGWDQNQVVSKLKGPRGTTVKIHITRPGVDEPIEMLPIRDEISRPTVSDSFMIRPRVGYIKLDSFGETTGEELRHALQGLDARQLDGLVFDLRGNGGGLLPQAIAVSETFLQKGQTILETRGRVRGSSRTYQSQRPNSDNLFPLVVLVNGQSASASEIVAGAIQDHDRGLIVGQTSFGKGLVQSVFELGRNAGLALTTQKWYTPSGRLIQRDYSHMSQFDYYNHRETPAKTDDIKRSGLGRIVYGGGGVTPDHVVEPARSNNFRDLLARQLASFTFALEFLIKNPTVDRSFQVTDAVLADFKQHLNKRGIRFSEKDFEANRDAIKQLIRYEVMFDKFGVSDAARVLLEDDPQLLKAIELLPEAGELAMKARRQAAALRR
jgi:carboxyl-terminal processing protease